MKFNYLKSSQLYHSFQFIILFFIILVYAIPAYACEGLSKTYETGYATICYSSENDLHKLTASLSKGLFSFLEGSNKPEVVRNRVDEIVEKAGSLLDMYPTDLHFTIILYPDNRELEKIYLKAAGIHAYGGTRTPVAFYSHKLKTIYVSLDNLSAGILAHEVAHAIINSYFESSPSARTQEILSQYVDRHLWEK